MATASSEPPVAAGGVDPPWPRGLYMLHRESFVSLLADSQEVVRVYCGF